MTSRYVCSHNVFNIRTSINIYFIASRLDRLLLLLDTGSSSSVRNTAAKQLAQLAAKSVISDVAVQDDIKSTRHHVPLGDSSAWSELMAVVARVSLARSTPIFLMLIYACADFTLLAFKEL